MLPRQSAAGRAMLGCKAAPWCSPRHREVLRISYREEVSSDDGEARLAELRDASDRRVRWRRAILPSAGRAASDTMQGFEVRGGASKLRLPPLFGSHPSGRQVPTKSRRK